MLQLLYSVPLPLPLTQLAVWLSGSVLVSINEVTVRHVLLVLQWMTVCGGHTISVSQPATQANSASYPPVEQEMSTSQRAVMLCG